MNRMRMRCALCCLSLLIVRTPAGFAQPAPPPAVLPTATLEMRFDLRGEVWTTLKLPFMPLQPHFYQQLLQTMLHAPLDRVREETVRTRWLLHAHAAGVLHRNGLTLEGELDLTMLLWALNLDGAQLLVVTLQHPRTKFSDSSLEASVHLLNTIYSSTVPTASSPPPIRLAFGYWPEDDWRFVFPSLTLLLPIGLILSWPSLRRGFGGDRFSSWFRSWRWHGWLLRGLWCLWLIAALVSGTMPLSRFLAGDLFNCGEWTWNALFLLLPPALAAIICKLLSAPAFAGVPEMRWTRGRLLQQGIWLQLGMVAIGACLGYGIDRQEADPSSHWAILSMVMALGLMVIALVGWSLSRQAAQDVLPPGELRERLFELADDAQVRVRQAYWLPPASWRLVNVFSINDDLVYLTPDVLPHLSRREVDALLALELARLWRRRRSVLWQLGTFFVLVIGFGILTGILAFFVSTETLLPINAGFLMVALVFRFRHGRHFASFLDRDVLTVTGDPEALITMLAKMHRLQLLPLVAGEERSTAAASSLFDWPRLQKLADRANIPPERLDEILDRPASGEDRYAPLPATPNLASGDDPRVFSRDFKRRSLALQSWTALAAEVSVPAGVAYLVQARQWQGVWLDVAYLLGLPLTILLRRFGVYSMALRTSLALRRGIRGKLEKDGLTPEAWGGLFVGLSPHAEPRNYENFLSWDLGFLILSSDRLCYLGDRTRFALDRASIQDMYLKSAPAGWRSLKRLYLVWRDEERGIGGTFNLILSEARSLWRRGPRTEKLAKRVREWLKQSAEPSALPPPLRELPAPNFGEVASESLGRLASPTILFGLLILRAPFVIVACLLLGLSFDASAGTGGWYVVLAVSLLQVWTVLSFLRYRGKKRDDDVDPDAPRRD